jgi:pimeloyl-ACP methyl ester carboxylesterase
MAFVPLVVAGLVGLMVYAATHPHNPVQEVKPGTLELHFEEVTFVTSDGIELEGALFPVLGARQVLEEKETALRKSYPGVVLVHDFGMRKDQMLPLVRPLHDAGFVVLAMNLRGNGGSGAAAQTFGLREAVDVASAVESLRLRPFVDPARVTVIAAGTGATAALRFAKSDPTLAALVLANPTITADSIVDTKLSPRSPLLRWMRPMCRWTFQIVYQVDIADVGWQQYEQVRQSRPVLVLGEEGGQTDFSRPKNIEQIRSFLVNELVAPKLPVVKVGEAGS